MAKTTYSLNLNGATSGSAPFNGGMGVVQWDSDASDIQTILNYWTLGGASGWVVTGTGPFTIEQPYAAGLFELTFSQDTLDVAPTLSLTNQAPIVSVEAPSGLTLTAKVFERGSDTLIETVTLSERTNSKCTYRGIVSEDEAGWHKLVIFSGSDAIGTQEVYLTTGQITHYAGDYCPIEDPSGILSTVGPSAASIRGAVGLASANLDTQLNATATTATAIKTKTDYLPSVTSGASGGLVIGSGTGTITLTSGGLPKVVDASGANVAAASSIPTLAGIASTVAAAITADHGSGNYATATALSTAQSSITAIKAKTDNLPSSPANVSDIPTTSAITSAVAAQITADHGSGNYATATALATAQSSINTLATTSQLASSSAALLAAIPSISTLATTSQLAASSAALLTQVNLAIATSAAILDDTGTNGVVVAAASKTGYKLASDGLDTISTTAPTGVASNFREMLVQVWRRFFKKATLTSTQLKTYADDGTTVVTTQAVTNTGGTETIGNAS